MLSFLVLTYPVPRTSEILQREGMNPAFRCGVYYMDVAFAEVSAPFRCLKGDVFA